jgi:DNA-binding response OmpR family regulator
MAEKILVVEDEIALQETLAYNLRRQGYEVRTCGDGASALDEARIFKPELVLLDVMLPGIDGFEVCRALRLEASTPVLMLTARDDEIDRVVGLEVGADDYMTKPFSMRELMARVKAMLRRVRMIREEIQSETVVAAAPVNSQILTFGSLELDLTKREIRLDSKALTVKPKEFELLVFLAQHHGQVVTRELILERVWDWNFIGDSRTVDVHVRWLREKIEADPSVPIRLVTVRGAGYRFDG